MIGHLMLGIDDLDGARAFYDAVLGTLGYAAARVEGERLRYDAPGAPALVVGRPRDGAPATFGNGSMIGFVAPTTDAVDAFHAAAMAHGGTNEGEPGPRSYVAGLYSAYVRDPVGNKLGVYRPPV